MKLQLLSWYIVAAKRVCKLGDRSNLSASSTWPLESTYELFNYTHLIRSTEAEIGNRRFTPCLACASQHHLFVGSLLQFTDHFGPSGVPLLIIHDSDIRAGLSTVPGPPETGLLQPP